MFPQLYKVAEVSESALHMLSREHSAYFLAAVEKWVRHV